jgi:hypothetical protein
MSEHQSEFHDRRLTSWFTPQSQKVTVLFKTEKRPLSGDEIRMQLCEHRPEPSGA